MVLKPYLFIGNLKARHENHMKKKGFLSPFPSPPGLPSRSCLGALELCRITLPYKATKG